MHSAHSILVGDTFYAGLAEVEGARAPSVTATRFPTLYRTPGTRAKPFLMLFIINITPSPTPGCLLFSLYAPHPQFRPDNTIMSDRGPSGEMRPQVPAFPHLMSLYHRTLRRRQSFAAGLSYLSASSSVSCLHLSTASWAKNRSLMTSGIRRNLGSEALGEVEARGLLLLGYYPQDHPMYLQISWKGVSCRCPRDPTERPGR